MGYRLEIRKITGDGDNEIKNIFYGTKLYGYEDYTDLLSAIYLYSIGKIEKDDYFNYGTNHLICLNKKEFTIFCNLYNIDMEKNQFEDEKNNWFINQEEIQKEMYEGIRYGYDNEVYLLSWC